MVEVTSKIATSRCMLGLRAEGSLEAWVYGLGFGFRAYRVYRVWGLGFIGFRV